MSAPKTDPKLGEKPRNDLPGQEERDRLRDIIGAERNRTGIAGYVNRDSHDRTSEEIASMRASSTRPITLPSTMAAGAQAHRPRQ